MNNNNITPLIVLNALVRHETLTFPDLLEEKNLGVPLSRPDVEAALQHLHHHQLVTVLDGAQPTTYTITEKGIEQSSKTGL